MYDVIIVGARVAGAPAAMLLAQQGYRVLLLDRASFPSDTLSTHQIQIKGGVMLKRWGLLDKVLSSNCPPARQATMHTGPLQIRGQYPARDGINIVVSPRRTVLDKILVDAAVAAGAELRQDFIVEEIMQEDGRVTGVRGRAKGAASSIEEKARLTIGADGKHSLVAQATGAMQYNQMPGLSCAYYTYWAGLQLDGGEMYSYPGLAAGFWPTNDGLTIIYTGYPVAEFPRIRHNIEVRFWQAMGLLPGMVDRLRAGQQADRFYGAGVLPAFYRRPFGPGWALVGDAGMTLDPLTGQGIGNAFWDAQQLADAIDAGFSGRATLESALAAYESERNKDTLPMYQFTGRLAALAPPAPAEQALFAALARQPDAAGRFFGALSGAIPLPEFFSPRNLVRVAGVGATVRLMLGSMAAERSARRAAQNREPGAAAEWDSEAAVKA